MKNNFKILFFFALFFSISNCLNTYDSNSEPSFVPIEIKIQPEYNQDLISTGEKFTLNFNTNYFGSQESIFDSSDIEAQTTITTQIKDENDVFHKIKCRLVKPVNDFIKLICDLEYEIKEGKYSIKLNDISFNYKEYKIKIISENKEFIIKKAKKPLNLFSFLNEENNDIIMNIKKEDNKNAIIIGKNGIIAFVTDYKDNDSLFNEDVEFNTKIKDDSGNEYEVNCRLWKPINDNIRIFCNLNENFANQTQNITLNDTSFEYNGNKISIYSEDYIKIEQYYLDVPFLYGDSQIININNNEQTYELKFKYDLYNRDILYIYGERNNYLIKK